MKTLTLLVLGSIALTGYGEGGEKTAGVVQAAGRSAGESLQAFGAKLAELSERTPEEARAMAQEVFDDASRALREAQDSEAVRRVAEELSAFVDRLGELRRSLAEKLDLAKLQQTVGDLIERFKADPRVAGALKTLQEKLDALGR